MNHWDVKNQIQQTKVDTIRTQKSDNARPRASIHVAQKKEKNCYRIWVLSRDVR